ncbi:hypothetical protein AVEN_113368-1 [Araneus ventricosus]|uniref:Uncharacterized protein n=1 Tax=Araneus ventricosus TaxID=182803 RepID=A0A4Y2ISQ3_ARAVE|nr:hypothetical protein AVEN_113368-1 [Araneus ventricosus]
MQLQMREISRKAQTLFMQDGYHHLLYYHKGSYITKVGWLMLHEFSVSVWSDGSGEGTPMNSARAELHLFSILHGGIKFYLPPHLKVRDENAKVREAATALSLIKGSILVPPVAYSHSLFDFKYERKIEQFHWLAPQRSS